MADKPIQDLVEATVVSEEDLFVLQQSNTAKKLKGRTLENWLLELAEGHGGISNIEKTGQDGLVDTYTITFADTTTDTFEVTNGREIRSIDTYYAVSSSNTTVPGTWYTERQTMTPTNRYLWSYQTFTFNGGNPDTISSPKTVIGVYGEKGDTGDQGVSVTGIVQQTVPAGSRYKDYKFAFSDGTYTNSIRIYDGRGISNIAKTDTDDLVDTYTISYNDNTTSTFQVKSFVMFGGADAGYSAQTEWDNAHDPYSWVGAIYSSAIITNDFTCYGGISISGMYVGGYPASWIGFVDGNGSSHYVLGYY